MSNYAPIVQWPSIQPSQGCDLGSNPGRGILYFKQVFKHLLPSNFMKKNWSLTKKWRFGVIALIILYVLTIPFRNYNFLNVEDVSILMHLIIVVILIVIYSVLLYVFDFVLSKIMD